MTVRISKKPIVLCSSTCIVCRDLFCLHAQLWGEGGRVEDLVRIRCTRETAAQAVVAATESA